MNARMEKYTEETGTKQRTKKNEQLYSEVQNMNIDYINIDVDNAVELSPSDNYKSSREDYQKQRELNKILPRKESTIYDDIEPEVAKENRVYDINEILKQARESLEEDKSDKKRLINTEYNILTKLDVDSLESDSMKKEDLKSLINDIYSKEKPLDKKSVDKSIDEPLLGDLIGDEKDENEEPKTVELKEELSKNILEDNESEEDVIATQISPMEKTGLEDSMFDFGFDKKAKKNKKAKKLLEEVDLEKEVTDKVSNDYIEPKEGKGLLIAIIVVVILILITCGFFVYQYFFGL